MVSLLEALFVSQCLSALLEPAKVKSILDVLKWKKKETSAHITPIQPLPCYSAPQGAIGKVATGGEDFLVCLCV